MTANEKNSANAMSDNKTIKALECCICNDGCEQCPVSEKCFFLYNKPYVETPEILRLSLDLINRQKAEIEELKKEINHYKINLPYLEHQNEDFCGVPCSFMENLVEQAKAEAIKEFWGRLQSIAYRSEVEWSHGEHPMLIELDDAEEIYEEMVGD